MLEEIAPGLELAVDYGFLTRDKGIYRVASELPGRGATGAGIMMFLFCSRNRKNRRGVTARR